MRRSLLLFFAFSFSLAAFPQIAPQKNFNEKVALMDKQSAAKFLKAPKVYNGINYDLKYERMHWNINPDTLFISGEVTSYFRTTQASVNKITFDFASAMLVDSVKYHSTIITWSHVSSDTLTIFLPAALAFNQMDSVSVFYHGSPPQGVDFGSFIKDSHNGTPIIWTLSEPYGAKDWWPCKNNLSDKIDSIDIYISTPQQYRSASNGMLVSETIQDTIKTAHWKHRYPIATYLIALAVTNYQTFSNYAHNGADSIQVLNYTYPEDLATAEADAPSVIKPLELFDSLFITYPFVKERYGMTRFNWGGGMEHQTMTFIHDYSYELMTHELAHQWVGDMITTCSWHDIWLNESFATYWTGLSYNFLFNGYYWPFWKQEQIATVITQPAGSVYVTDTTNVNNVFDERLQYSKGAMLLNMLRWTIGDSAFFAGFRNYLTDTNLTYKYACSDDFINHMQNASGKNLTEFFNDWLYGQGYPIYSIQCSFAPFTNDVRVVINQTTSDPSVSFYKMPVPIEFKDATHDTILVFDNTFSGQQFIANAGFRPDTIRFDPNYEIVAKLDTVMLGINEPSSSHLFSMFPNPVTDDLTIDFSGYPLQSAELYDIRGMLIRSVNTNGSQQGTIKIKMADLAKGIYFIKAIFNDSSVIRKVEKM